MPPGVYYASPDEIIKKFCFNQRRKQLFEGLLVATTLLKRSGCSEVFLDGSFSTSKEYPGDIDVCWNPINVDSKLLFNIEPVFFDMSNGRTAQKAKFGCEFFKTNTTVIPDMISFLDFFQKDKDDDSQKGIIGLKL